MTFMTQQPVGLIYTITFFVGMLGGVIAAFAFGAI